MKNIVRMNFIFNSIYQLTNILVPVVTMPYLSRVLGAKGLGEYSFAYSVAFYYALFVKLGLQNYGNRLIAETRSDRDVLSETFWGIYLFQLIMGVLLTIAYFIYVFCFSLNSLSIVLSIVVISATLDITWFLYGMEEFKVAAIRDVIVKIAVMVGILFFVKTNRDVTKYAAIYSLGMLLSQLSAWPILRRNTYFIKPKKENIKKHIRPNVKLFIPVIAVSLYTMMDKIMIGIFSTNSEVGYYHCAENVIQIPLALITALGTVMMPRMTNMIANGTAKAKLQSNFDISIIITSFITTSIGFGLMTIASEFVPLFYGKGFDKCIKLFYVLLPSCIFVGFANVIRTQFLIPYKRDDVFIKSILIGAAINVIANFILIPHYASIGASIGTFLAELSVCVVQSICVFAEANIGKNIIRTIPFLVAGIVMFFMFRSFKADIKDEWMGIMIKVLICGLDYLTILAVIMLPTYMYRLKRMANT